jgi:hypothetical protein
MWLWMLGAAVLGVAAIVVAQYRAASRHYVPLSHRQPDRHKHNDKVPLGHEALDMTEVLRTQRLHQGLERTTSFYRGLGGGSDAPNLIDPEGPSLPDDETYSARYHAAFQTKKHKDTSK